MRLMNKEQIFFDVEVVTKVSTGEEESSSNILQKLLLEDLYLSIILILEACTLSPIINILS